MIPTYFRVTLDLFLVTVGGGPRNRSGKGCCDVSFRMPNPKPGRKVVTSICLLPNSSNPKPEKKDWNFHMSFSKFPKPECSTPIFSKPS